MQSNPFDEPDDDFEPEPKKRSRKPVKIKPTKLRIVAGDLGSRRIEYNGDPATRPMKEKTREAVFSLLGGYLEDTYAIDLFAGTGILGFESISRGSIGATLLEYSRTTVNSILANLRTLGIDEYVDVQNVDTLRWLKSSHDQTASLPRCPWIIYCCPPYAMWMSDTDLLISGLNTLMDAAPEGSKLVCETEEKFDLAARMPSFDWDVRNYKPAVVSICIKHNDESSDQ